MDIKILIPAEHVDAYAYESINDGDTKQLPFESSSTVVAKPVDLGGDSIMLTEFTLAFGQPILENLGTHGTAILLSVLANFLTEYLKSVWNKPVGFEETPGLQSEALDIPRETQVGTVEPPEDDIEKRVKEIEELIRGPVRVLYNQERYTSLEELSEAVGKKILLDSASGD